MDTRERFARFGASRFSDTDLLALVLGAGDGPSADAAQALLAHFGSLSGLADAEVAEVQAVPHIGLARAVQILAALRVGRRSLLPVESRPTIRSAQDAYIQIYAELSGLSSETFYALYLSRRRVLLGTRVLSVGNDANTIVDPRQVYQRAVRMGAAGIIVAHNHPSGDPTPSPQDILVTHHLAQAGDLLGVELLDHLIVGSGRFVSLAEQRLLRPSAHSPALIQGGEGRGLSGPR